MHRPSTYHEFLNFNRRGVPATEYIEERYDDLDVFSARAGIEIVDSNETLIEIPSPFLRFEPHPYRKAGAVYPRFGPFHLRTGVVERLVRAQEFLQKERPELRLKIFDGYRPNTVQQYMVDWTARDVARSRKLDLSTCTESQRDDCYKEVFKIWAPPSTDLKRPPPHSTGACVDLTIADSAGNELDMGAPIDAMPPEGKPSYYRQFNDELSRQRHANRELLRSSMETAGFQRLAHEWWHFSYGDQLWALFHGLDHRIETPRAIYGRVE